MKYLLPQFLEGRVSLEKYRRWLQLKAQAHVTRDRKRGHTVTVAGYKIQIHEAVQASLGFDWYTGEALDWERISTWDNAQAKALRSAFKADFALLPTVDHVLGEDGTFTFVICGWRTNDAKSDMVVADLITFCRKVIAHHDQITGRDDAEADVGECQMEWPLSGEDSARLLPSAWVMRSDAERMLR